MFRFITKQSFLVNLIAAIAFVLILIALFFLSLGWITNHGSYLQVPSVTGIDADKAIQQLQEQGFDVIVTDSAYNDSMKLNIVRKQLPLSGATVKVNRTVFLQVNPKVLPMVSVPKLEGLSYRFAIDYLNKNNLVLGDTTERPDFMKGSVLDQLYRGKSIAAGQKVRWGSKIDLVIGGGVQAVQIPVPDIIGMTVADVRNLLASKGIILASVVATGNISDTTAAYVYKQNPEPQDFDGNNVFIQPGQTMDIWIQTEKPRIDSLVVKPENEQHQPTVPTKSDY